MGCCLNRFTSYCGEQFGLAVSGGSLPVSNRFTGLHAQFGFRLGLRALVPLP